MAKLIELNTHQSSSGELTVFEKILPGTIKRVFYIHNTQDQDIRGGHRHKEAHHALVCLKGSCQVLVQNKDSEQRFSLNSPNLALILEPSEWRLMDNFEKDSILLVISNQYFSEEDYIYESYHQVNLEPA
jgi:hypothetical protein